VREKDVSELEIPEIKRFATLALTLTLSQWERESADAGKNLQANSLLKLSHRLC